MKRIFLLFAFLLPLLFSQLASAQKAADRFYQQGLECMKIMTIVSQKSAIGYFTKARAAFDSKQNKVLCDQQIAVCRSILQTLDSKERRPVASDRALRGKSTRSSSASGRAGQIHMANAVDLGLSVLWADCNVGASTIDDVGGRYGWGDATGKLVSDNSNDYAKGNNPVNICGDSRYDIATALWGNGWRLPSVDEFLELYHRCSWTWEIRDGQAGYRVSAFNGNSIFLPAGGHREGTEVVDKGEWGDYWSGSNYPDVKDWAFTIVFDKNSVVLAHYFKCWGKCVRPVRNR